ncbi:WD repeat-containing protein RUP2 [Diospyros lotus]|uniref:WD repeat-containing protein RUP2 n=1 Tax=Diospyros lotus TaxID=55363 RepID=UPI002259D414|nr:WD repeat-containing protein RUP2 [Diospyros lotus]
MKNFSAHSNIIQPNPETEQEGKQEKGQHDDEEEGSGARCDWDFTLSTIVSSSSSTCDTLGAIEFDPSGNLLATGGIARKIRVYSFNSLLPHGKSTEVSLLDHNSACDYCICTPAKLSSLKWRPCSDGRVIGSGDYDGVVMEYDLERRVPIFERDEHGGRRVWSVGYSHWDPVVGASGADDGTVQMWDPRCDGDKCVGAVQPSAAGSSVCCVEFNPFGGDLIAVGCADRRAYGYDVRKMQDPVLVLDGHSKTVTYVRFLDHRTVVTSGADGCLKLWSTEDQNLVRTYKGHLNSKRFVGLSVWKHGEDGGLIGCGSESNQVFVYDKRWGEPIWVHGFQEAAQPGFVSGLCWRRVGEDHSALVAGGSDGVLQVYEVSAKEC